MNRRCLDCDTPITGRSDKKYCSDQCRNAWHNRQNFISNTMVRRVNGILRHNRKILRECFTMTDGVVDKQKLSARGFNFHFLTHFEMREDNLIRNCCYDYGWMDKGKSVQVVKSESVLTAPETLHNTPG